MLSVSLNREKLIFFALGLYCQLCKEERHSFTDPIAQTRQVLVQRKPGNWRSITEEAAEKSLIKKAD